MKPEISVVIPVLNEGAFIAPLLQVLEGIPGVELIVVDGGSRDDTLAVVSRYPSVHCVHSPPGRGIQMNRGAAVAEGTVLWFLHADSTLPPNWKSAILATMNAAGVVAGCFPLRFDCDHGLLRLFSRLSRWNHPLFTFGDQAYFLKRATFHSVGGFRDFPILEDLEIQRRLRRMGSWRKCDCFISTSARRFVKGGILKQQLRNIGIVSLFLAGASPYWLKRFYAPNPVVQASAAAQSASRKPAALKESPTRKGRLTRFPLWLKSLIASFVSMVGNLSFKARAR